MTDSSGAGADNPLYVGFSSGRGIVAWLIRLFTGGKVNHAFLFFKMPYVGWVTLGANSNGVTEITLEQFLKSRTIEALFLPKDRPVDFLWTGLAKIKDDIDKRYDWAGVALGEIAMTIAHRLFHEYKLHNALSDPNRLFCSEFATDVIRASGYAFLGTIPDDAIDPQMAYEGLLKNEDFFSCPVPSGTWV